MAFMNFLFGHPPLECYIIGHKPGWPRCIDICLYTEKISYVPYYRFVIVIVMNNILTGNIR